jgi:glycosyltransferase involved in cell wall biosynthesis
LVAGVQAHQPAELDCIEPEHCRFITFHRGDIAFPIVGMSDVMPYPSACFSELSSTELDEYEGAFTNTIQSAVSSFCPDLIHSHHLWILTALVRRLFPNIPVVTTCHGSDLRQFQNCTHLHARVLEGCRRVDRVMALSADQKKEIERLYGFSSEKVVVVGSGYNDRLFKNLPKTLPPPAKKTNRSSKPICPVPCGPR